MKSICLLFSVGLLLSLASCMGEIDESPVKQIPDKDELPEITFEGRDIIACRVNGEKFLSKFHWTLYGSVGPNISIFNKNILYISGMDLHSMYGWSINLASHYTEGQTDLYLDNMLSFYYTGMNFDHGLTSTSYEIIPSEPHHLKLLHLDDRIAVGTFAFTAVSDEGDTLNITDGRFDISRKD